jgi:hypothetical protein
MAYFSVCPPLNNCTTYSISPDHSVTIAIKQRDAHLLSLSFRRAYTP